MGIVHSTGRAVHNVTNYIAGFKRKHSDTEEENEMNKIIDVALHTPKRIKLHTTARYIYQALFEEGKNSDVTVCALDQEFALHKIYLCQSPYFASMFGGSWLEANKKYIHIDIVDSLITINSLKVVFGSLYDTDIVLDPLQIVSILATATMFQLDGLIEKCTELMLETINPKTCLEYYNAACQYGEKRLQEVCFEWFLVNLMTYYFPHPSIVHLRSIPVQLMTKLVAHPDLFVMQTEYSVYLLLKYWVHILMTGENVDDYCENQEDAPTSKQVNDYFGSRKGQTAFLLTREGARFAPAFRALRIAHLLTHQTDVELVVEDNIIPRTWIDRVLLQQWKQVLRVNQNDDKGPCDITDELFLATSARCGRTVLTPESHVWRWTGFHFGTDLLMLTKANSLSIKRNHRSEFEQLLSFQTSRHIAIRVIVARLNEQRQMVQVKRSGILNLALAKGEEVEIMQLDQGLEYPIIVSANILYTGQPDRQDGAEEA